MVRAESWQSFRMEVRVFFTSCSKLPKQNASGNLARSRSVELNRLIQLLSLPRARCCPHDTSNVEDLLSSQ
ncbi:unnamed protein product [Caretta caretta]